MATNLSELTIEQLRQRYLWIQDRVSYYGNLPEWQRNVRKVVTSNPTPQDWVVAAEKADTTCIKCRGSGIYVGTIGNVVHNGVIPTYTATCNQCQGNGRITASDAHRCHEFWKHYVPSC
jgi:hypothetical protein